MDIYAPALVPFDAYVLTALMFVIEKATNKSVPIIALAAGEGPDNFVVSSFEDETRSNYTYNPGTGPTTVEVDSNAVVMIVKRSQLAKAFTLCLFIVNIGLAFGSTYVTFVAFSRRGKVHEGVLLLPVTIILTIPTLRGLYAGSPPFGIYLGTSQVLRLRSRTDATLRYVGVLPADDDSCGVFHGTVALCCWAVRAG